MAPLLSLLPMHVSIHVYAYSCICTTPVSQAPARQCRQSAGRSLTLRRCPGQQRQSCCTRQSGGPCEPLPGSCGASTPPLGGVPEPTCTAQRCHVSWLCPTGVGAGLMWCCSVKDLSDGWMIVARIGACVAPPVVWPQCTAEQNAAGAAFSPLSFCWIHCWGILFI